MEQIFQREKHFAKESYFQLLAYVL